VIMLANCRLNDVLFWTVGSPLGWFSDASEPVTKPQLAPVWRLRSGPITKHYATSQDQSVQPRYAATWRGVMQVGLLRSHGRLLRPISACDRMKLQTFFDAAHLLICCEPRWAGRDMPVGLLIVGRTSRSLSGL
jgi:hypothetical protein